MEISRIRLKNWRNFRQVDVSVAQRVFIVGPNASGKSNFLDALRFLRDVAKQGGGLQKAIADRGGLSKIRCLAAREDPNVEIEVEIKSDEDKRLRWKYRIGIKQQSRGHHSPYLGFEEVWENGIRIIGRPDPDDEKDEERLTHTHLEQINANEKFRDVARFLESISYLHLVPQFIRHPGAFSGPGIEGDPYGLHFLERVARTSEKTRKSRLRKIEAVLQRAVPHLKAFKDIQDEIGHTHLEAVYAHWRAKGAKQREDQFSDGTLRLIGLMWVLLDGTAPILLEEPEMSLNAGIVRKVPALISKLQEHRGRQVFLSTHSAELLSDRGIRGEETLLLEPSESEGTKVIEAAEDKEIHALLEGGMSIADAALSRATPRDVDQLAFRFDPR